MLDLTGKKKVDRLPILVSGDEGSKLLAVPKLPDSKAAGTSQVIMTGVYETESKPCALTQQLSTQALVLVCVSPLNRLLGEISFTSLTTITFWNFCLKLNYLHWWHKINPRALVLQSLWHSAISGQLWTHRSMQWALETLRQQLFSKHGLMKSCNTHNSSFKRNIPRMTTKSFWRL